MKVTMELELTHKDGTGRDDPERVADIAYYQLMDGQMVDAGDGPGDALYQVTGYTLVKGESEHGPDDVELDVHPDAVEEA
jgi:hypothetical protein